MWQCFMKRIELYFLKVFFNGCNECNKTHLQIIKNFIHPNNLKVIMNFPYEGVVFLMKALKS